MRTKKGTSARSEHINMEMEGAQQTGGNVMSYFSGNNSSSNQRRTTTRRVEDQDRDNMDNSSDSEE